MAATLQVFTWTLTVDATNRDIPFNRGGAKNAQIAAADYGDIWSVGTFAGSLAKRRLR